jgi:hypothetical protein
MMLHTDWNQWATSRPEWVRDEIEEAFERFEEQKWKDGLNVAAAELFSWEAKGTRPGRPAVEKQAGNPKKPWGKGTNTGVAAVEAAPGGNRKRKCHFFQSLGCKKGHPAFMCDLLKGPGQKVKSKVLEDSGLCLFCMRHTVECFSKGTRSQPA